MKTLLTIAAAGALLSTAALAQAAVTQPDPSKSAKTPEANISSPAMPPSTIASASSSSQNLRQQFRSDLQKAG